MSDNESVSSVSSTVQSAVSGPERTKPVRKRGPTSRNVCYTIHRPADFDDEQWEARIERVKLLPAKYHVFGREKCPTTGRQHLQGYIEFGKPKAYSSVYTELGFKFTMAARRGTALQASDYCKKDDDIFEAGVLSQPSGTRNDLTSAVESVKSNPNQRKRQFLEDHTAVLAKYPRFVDTLFGIYRPVDTLNWTDSPNKFIYGAAGVGKSKHVRTLYPKEDLYVKTHNKWFCGYDGEAAILIDDLHPDNARYMTTNIKIWSDRYPFRAETKGSIIHIRPAAVIITSNYSIEELFLNPQDQAAIRRRFHVTHMLQPLM